MRARRSASRRNTTLLPVPGSPLMSASLSRLRRHRPAAAVSSRGRSELMNKKLNALYGLKWNPFSPELPTEALLVSAKLESFCWRIENSLVREGGFALISGDPGTGKSVVLRLLAERLARIRDLTVGALTRPSSRVYDFYREMGELFA